MFNKLVISVLCFSLSGCLYQTTNNTEIKKAIHFCRGADNIQEVTIYAVGNGAVKCISGEWERLYDISIKGEK